MAFRIYLNVDKNNERVFEEQIFGNNEWPKGLSEYFDKTKLVSDKDEDFKNIEIPIMELIEIMRLTEIEREPNFWQAVKMIKEDHEEPFNTMKLDLTENYKSINDFCRLCSQAEQRYLLRFPVLIQKLIALNYIRPILQRDEEEGLILKYVECDGIELTIDGF